MTTIVRRGWEYPATEWRSHSEACPGLRDQFITLLKRLTYKPAAMLETPQDDDIYRGLVTLTATSYVLDANGSARLVPVTATNPMRVEMLADEKGNLDEKRALGFIRDTLKMLEFHEVDEWFRIDGKHVTDPHPPLPIYGATA